MNKIKISALFFMAYANVAFATESKSNDIKVITKFVASLAQVAEDNNLSKIAKMLGVSNGETVRRALGNSKILPYQKESMLSLLARAKSVVITPVSYENADYQKYGNGYTVFFVVSDSVSDVLLGKKAWLLDYIACDFFVKNSKVNYGPNICYSETEGPFSIKYNEDL